MRCAASLDEVRERAALRALGILGANEAEVFDRHIAAGCEVCSTELEAFRAVVSEIGISEPAATPSPRVRAALVERIKGITESGIDQAEAASSGKDAFLFVRANEGEWHELQPGIFVKQLYVDERTGTMTSLVRMTPGTRLTPHRHTGVEQFYVLEGDCNVRGEVLGPGDYHRAEAGTIHEATFTRNGTLFLLLAPVDYEACDSTTPSS